MSNPLDIAARKQNAINFNNTESYTSLVMIPIAASTAKNFYQSRIIQCPSNLKANKGFLVVARFSNNLLCQQILWLHT